MRPLFISYRLSLPSPALEMLLTFENSLDLPLVVAGRVSFRTLDSVTTSPHLFYFSHPFLLHETITLSPIFARQLWTETIHNRCYSK